MRISDWSSDVCSSDLPHRRTPKATSPKASRRKRDNLIATPRASFPNPRNNKSLCFRVHDERGPQYRATDRNRRQPHPRQLRPRPRRRELGRGACRERVCQYVYISVVSGSLKKKKATSTTYSSTS